MRGKTLSLEKRIFVRDFESQIFDRDLESRILEETLSLEFEEKKILDRKGNPKSTHAQS